MNLSFDDVLLLPQFSTIKSRKDVDLTTKLGIDTLSLPIISSNMSCVTGPEMSKAMLSHGGQACLHRFQSIEENIKQLESGTLFESSDEYYRPWVSLGLGPNELERAEALLHAGAQTFLIDVAHGASMSVVEQTKALRELVGDKSIIVGNFATKQTLKDFITHLGGTKIEAVKVGIGGGSACTTRLVTGCGVPTFSSVVDCASVGIPVIADGGIRNSGDVAKALGAGAKLVMLGRMLAGSVESPAECLYRQITLDEEFDFNIAVQKLAVEENISLIQAVERLKPQFEKQLSCTHKKYKGSASQESYVEQGKTAHHRTAEGESFIIPYTGPVTNTLQQIEAGLRSSMSYVGASTLDEFRKQAKFIQVSGAAVIEGTAHGARS